MSTFSRIDVMFHRRRFERVAEHPFFKFVVCHREAVMLSLMFGPGIHQKRLKIEIRGLRVIENSPPRGAVAAANSLIPIDLLQEIRRFQGINDIFDRHENRAKIGGVFLEHARVAPMIPRAEVNSGAGKSKWKLQAREMRRFQSRKQEEPDAHSYVPP